MKLGTPGKGGIISPLEDSKKMESTTQKAESFVSVFAKNESNMPKLILQLIINKVGQHPPSITPGTMMDIFKNGAQMTEFIYDKLQIGMLDSFLARIRTCIFAQNIFPRNPFVQKMPMKTMSG